MATCRECLHEGVCYINEVYGEDDLNCGNCLNFTPKSDYVKRERGEWVSVKDRLPDEDKQYLCSVKIGDMFVCIMLVHYSHNLAKTGAPNFEHLFHSGWYLINESGDYEIFNLVTHWQPLPEPPGKKKKCGKCNKNDGRLYLSDPPQVKCTITGRYHCLDEECDITSNDNPELLKGGVDNESNS